MYTGVLFENAINVEILMLRATDADGPGVNSAIQFSIISKLRPLYNTYSIANMFHS